MKNDLLRETFLLKYDLWASSGSVSWLLSVEIYWEPKKHERRTKLQQLRFKAKNRVRAGVSVPYHKWDMKNPHPSRNFGECISLEAWNNIKTFPPNKLFERGSAIKC